jgi:hypothetical protein
VKKGQSAVRQPRRFPPIPPRRQMTPLKLNAVARIYFNVMPITTFTLDQFFLNPVKEELVRVAKGDPFRSFYTHVVSVGSGSPASRRRR